MAWTSLLEHKRIPDTAIVIADLPCATCGYNLRTLRAAGVCPECGQRILDSMSAVPEPGATAGGLQSMALSAFGLAAAPLLLFNPTTNVTALVIAGLVLIVAGGNRLVGAVRLRLHSRLEHHGAVGLMIRLLFWLTLVDIVLLLLAFCIGFACRTSTRIEPIAQLVAWGAWCLVHLAWLLAAAEMARRFARWLEWNNIRYESIAALLVHGAAIVLGGVCMALGASRSLGAGATTNDALFMLGLTLLIVGLLAGVCCHVVAMLHLAGAVEMERDRIDEYIDPHGADSARTVKDEPDIPLE
jgi:hypothetical protein